MLEPTIPLEKMQEFEHDYFAGKFPHQRYGQAFCNHFNITNSQIFYDEDDRNNKVCIWLNFVIFPDSLLEE